MCFIYVCLCVTVSVWVWTSEVTSYEILKHEHISEYLFTFTMVKLFNPFQEAALPEMLYYFLLSLLFDL